MDYVIVEKNVDGNKNKKSPILITSAWLVDGDKFCLLPEYFTSNLHRNNAISNHQACDTTKEYTKVPIRIIFRSPIYEAAESRLHILLDYLDEHTYSDCEDGIDKHQTMPKQHVNIHKNVECSSCQTQYIINEVLKNQLQMKKDLQNITEILLQSVITSTDSLSRTEGLRTLKSIEEICQFNKDLIDDEIFTQMLSSLYIFGGRNIRTTVKSFLDKLISTQAAINMSWTGAHNKFNFSEMINIIQLILLSTKQNAPTKNANLDDIEGEIKRWIRSNTKML